jgi:Protein of unknown function (DUF2785)
VLVACVTALLGWAPAAGAQAGRTKEAWVTLAKGGFVLPAGQYAVDVLLDMNALLASPDPVLRDEVAFGAAERWILRDKAVDAAGLRRVRDQWVRNLDQGLGESGTDTVFGRSFSALCLSLVAAADLQAPFLEPAEVQGFFDRMLDYFAQERDLRGFDATRGWMHTAAHTADALKFLARNPKLAPGTDTRLLAAVRSKIEAGDAVFVWGENDRIAQALHSAVHRADADPAALEAWTAHWASAHRAMWSTGPQVNPRTFAQVENAKQVMRSLHAALAMEAAPTANGTAAAKTVLAALAKMR